MRRIVHMASAVLLTLVLLLMPALAKEADTQAQLNYVTDAGQVLPEDVCAQMETNAAELAEKTGCGVYFVTLEDYTDYSSGTILQCAEELYNIYELGWTEERNGILLLLSMEDRTYTLMSQGSYANAVFTDTVQAEMVDAILAYLGRDDWAGGAQYYLDQCKAYLSKGPTASAETSKLSGKELLISLAVIVGVPCLAAGGICFIWKRNMRSVSRQKTARAYVTPDGVSILVQEDRYTHSTQSRIQIESDVKNVISSAASSSRSGKF